VREGLEYWIELVEMFERSQAALQQLAPRAVARLAIGLNQLSTSSGACVPVFAHHPALTLLASPAVMSVTAFSVGALMLKHLGTCAFV